MLLVAGPACAANLEGIEPVRLILASPSVNDDGMVAEVDGRFLFHPADPEAITGGILRLHEDPALKAGLAFLALARARTGGDPDLPVVVVVTDRFGNLGPLHVVRPARLQGTETRDLEAFLVLSPFPEETKIDLEKATAAGMTGRMLVHELGHQILHEVLGFDLSRETPFPSDEIRNLPVVTDPVLAFSEGFAEALESAISGSPGIPPLEAVADLPLRRIQRARQDWLVRDRYIWESLPELDGEILSGFQMLSTEGVVGSLVHELLTNRGLGRGDVRANFERMVDILHEKKCRDFRSLFEATMAASEGSRQTMLRILLETTRYTTVDAAAGPMASETYRTSLAAKRALPADASRDELTREAADAKRGWKHFKEGLFAEVLAGTRSPFATVPDADGALWIEDRGRRVALNLARPVALADFLAGLWGDGKNALALAGTLITAREAGAAPYFADVEALAPHLGDEARVEKLRAARATYVESARAAQGTAGLSAYLRPDPSLFLRALQQLGS